MSQTPKPMPNYAPALVDVLVQKGTTAAHELSDADLDAELADQTRVVTAIELGNLDEEYHATVVLAVLALDRARRVKERMPA